MNVRLAGDHQCGKLQFIWLSLVMSLIVSFYAVFSKEMSWIRSGTELNQFLRVFLPTHTYLKCKYGILSKDSYLLYAKCILQNIVFSCLISGIFDE